MATEHFETERQRALDAYHVVDTFPEAAYDDIALLATQLCGVPIAIVSLIDRERQWFKAKAGLPMSETPRDIAFCDHAIRMPDQLLEVPDATADARFRDNPLVTGALGIRFYAGMPLTTPSGAAIGTVCVIDREPRVLTDDQRKGLAALSRLVMNLLEARHRQRELERAVLFAADTAGGAPAAELESTDSRESPESPESKQCTIAIVEVQDLTAATVRLGSRAIRRTLTQLEQLLQSGLRPKQQDSVSHVTDSAEMIVMLHGANTTATLQAQCKRVTEFEREHDLTVLVASAHSAVLNEPLESVYLRADLALSQAKDARLAA